MSTEANDALTQLLVQNGQILASLRNVEARSLDIRRELSNLHVGQSQLNERVNRQNGHIAELRTRLDSMEGPIGDIKKVRLLGAVAIWVVGTLSTVAISVLTIATDIFGLLKGHH